MTQQQLSPATQLKIRAELELRRRQEESEKAALSKQRRYQRDPVAWMREVLGEEPWGMQAQIMESVRDNDETAVASCHAIGKSWSASRIVGWFLNAFTPSIVVTTAPTRRHVEAILWQEIAAAKARSKTPLPGKLLSTRWEMAPKHFAIGFTGRQKAKGEDGGEALVGLHQDHILVVIDEASGIDAATEEELDALLSSGKTVRKLSIGNPVRPSGPFFEAFQRPRTGLKTFQVCAFDTPNFTTFGITLDDIRSGAWEEKVGDAEMPSPHLINPRWVRGKWEKWGENSPAFQSRIMARFPSDTTDALIPLHLLEAAQQREVEPGYPHRQGLDVARFGSDNSVQYERRGNVFRLVDSWQGLRTTETVKRASHNFYANGAEDIVVDSVGVGAGVVDQMYDEGLPVVALNVGDTPADDDGRFMNLRAELYWKIREMAEAGTLDLDPEDDDLVAELSNIRYQHRKKDGAIQIEAKAEMKRRGMGSPDHADALMLTLAPDGYDSEGGGGGPVIV